MVDNFFWYVNLMNFLCEKALKGEMLTKVETDQLNHCIDKYDVADSVTELINDIADANDCGICKSWQDIVNALSEQFKNGERM